MAKPNLLDSRNGRFIAFGFLYISEGIPYGFATTAMVMFMRLEGLSIEQIGAFVAAVLLPWVPSTPGLPPLLTTRPQALTILRLSTTCSSKLLLAGASSAGVHNRFDPLIPYLPFSERYLR